MKFGGMSLGLPQDRRDGGVMASWAGKTQTSLRLTDSALCDHVPDRTSSKSCCLASVAFRAARMTSAVCSLNRHCAARTMIYQDE